MVLLIGGIALGMALQRRFGSIEQAKERAFCHKIPALQHLADGKVPLPTGIEELQLAIGPKSYHKLREKRAAALRQGVLVKGKDDFVGGRLYHQGKDLPIKLRLKGDLLDHLEGKKWSFRIETKGDATLDGMKRFSLHRPETRHHVWEWLIYRMLEEAGLITLRYRFVNLTLNGEYLGIYALEEHFERRLIEHNQRRDGPILKFDMSLWQAERVGYYGHEVPGSGQYYSVPVDVFQGDRLAKDSLFVAQFQQGHALLMGFREGELPADQVFDLERWAHFIAICDLFGAHHALNTHQFRFYMNPLTQRLEPVPYDHNAGHSLDRLAGTYTEEDYYQWEGGFQTLFLATLFRDPTFFALYTQALQQYTSTGFLEDFLATEDSALQAQLATIYLEYPCFQFDPNILYGNRRFIQRMLHPPKGLHAYLKKQSPHQVTLEVANIQRLPVKVLGLKISPQKWMPFNHKPQTPNPRPSPLLPPKHPKFRAQYQTLAFPLSSHDTLPHTAQLAYQILGSRDTLYSDIFPWPHIDIALLEAPVMVAEKLDAQPFLVVNKGQQEIHFLQGKWEVKKPLHLPEGYTVKMKGGTELVFSEGAFLKSRSPISWIGSKESPIRLSSPDSSGGVLVAQTDAPSTMAWVICHNMATPRGATGAINFYESTVYLRNCTFLQNPTEDALNLIRSDFEVVDCYFGQSKSDALDVDFCRGKIANCTFVELGNDAIDLSGSMVFAQSLVIKKAGDKGISIGEESQWEGDDILISESNICVASKDQSKAFFKGLTLQMSEVGLTAFQKKAEFGPAEIVVTGLHHEGVKTPFLLERGSRIFANGKEIEIQK